MKGILVLLDGLCDRPCSELGGKTPLDMANTPNLDFFISSGAKLGLMYPVKPGFIPESDESLMSIFGNNFNKSIRGELEAIGSGFDLKRGDLSFRVNFASVDKKTGIILDRRVGRVLKTSEADALANAISKIKFSYPFLFKPTTQHRAVLVLKGGFSDIISTNDSGYFQGRVNEVDKISFCKALDDSDNSIHTANVVNVFLERACAVLEEHPVNLERVRNGLLPANYFLLRGACTEIPKVKDYHRWTALVYTPLEKGFAKISGMKVFSFNYPKLDNFDAYENIQEGLKAACSLPELVLEENKDLYHFCYIHVNETDFPGHDNRPIDRVKMLEYLDKTLFSYLRFFCLENSISLVVTANQATPCVLKNHSADPVPVLFFNPSSVSIGGETHFCEESCLRGELGEFKGRDLLKKVGFDK